MRQLPITMANVMDWFPAPHVENPFAASSWWQIQSLGLLAAMQLLRIVPESDALQQSLIELRRSIDTALLMIPAPDDAEIERRMSQTLAPYCPSSFPVVDAMLDMAELRTDDVLYDLGSGDGRIVLAAAERGVRAVGIDIDALFVAEATERADDGRLRAPVSFVHADILTADISDATVITCYLVSHGMAALQEKFRTLRAGTRIISHAFSMSGWEPDAMCTVGNTPIFRWTV